MNQEMINDLNLTVECLMFYEKQDNGFLAREILNRLAGGH